MEGVSNERPGEYRLPIFAACGLLILPARVFLGAAVIRLLQPRQYEPARTSWTVFEWAMTHVSRSSAAILFVAMPSVVLIAGCAALLRNWRQEQSMCPDSALTPSIR